LTSSNALPVLVKKKVCLMSSPDSTLPKSYEVWSKVIRGPVLSWLGATAEPVGAAAGAGEGSEAMQGRAIMRIDRARILLFIKGGTSEGCSTGRLFAVKCRKRGALHTLRALRADSLS